MPSNVEVKHRRGSAAQWASTNPVLGSGEMGLELDTLRVKFGDGVTPWLGLVYFGQAAQTNIATGTEALMVGPERKVFPYNTKYSAFPSITKLADGRMFMVWYEGTDHATTRDGVVRGSYSSDKGVTWTPAHTVLSVASTDLRDPCVSTNFDGSSVYLTYFKGSNVNAAAGFFIRVSDSTGANFGAEVRIDPHPYAAGCSPAVQLPNGQLLVTWYGKASLTDAYDSVWVARSTTNGATWGTPTKVADGVALGNDMQEPYAIASGANVVIMHRHGNLTNIARVASGDSGATWGATAVKFAGTGRANTILTTQGTMIVNYRQVAGSYAQQHGMVRWSRDLGVTWSGAQLLEPTNNSWWLYSSLIETLPGQVLATSAVEVSGTLTEMSLRYLTEGAGVNPFGDITPNQEQRVFTRANTIVAVDDFNRPDASFATGDLTVDGVKWASQGNATIKESALDDRAAVGPRVHYVRTLSTSHEVEAQFTWSGSPGVALICRLQDQNNYLMATIETSGTAARIYKVVGGVATQLGTTATVNVPASVWQTMRFSCIGTNLRFYLEDQLVVTANDSTFSTMGNAGVRTGTVTAGTVHRFRNFVARRRSEINV